MEQTHACFQKSFLDQLESFLTSFCTQCLLPIPPQSLKHTDPEGLGEVPPEHTKPAISHYLPRKGCQGLSPVPPSKGRGIVEALIQKEEGDLQQYSGLSPLGTKLQGKVVLTCSGIGVALRSLVRFLAGVGFSRSQWVRGNPGPNWS